MTVTVPPSGRWHVIVEHTVSANAGHDSGQMGGTARAHMARAAGPSSGSQAVSGGLPHSIFMSDEINGRGRIDLKGKAVLTVEPPVTFQQKFHFGSSSQVGAFTYLNSGVAVSCQSIGRYCSIAGKARIGEHQHPVEWLSSNPFQYNRARFAFSTVARHYRPLDPAASPNNFRKPAPRIGNDVWLGSHV